MTELSYAREQNRILINGNFLCRALTGIERFAFETVKAMDDMLGEEADGRGRDISIAIFAPCNALNAAGDAALQYKNIKVITSSKPLRSFPFWDMVTFPRECKKLGCQALSFSNTAPLGKRCGFAFIHDVYHADCRGDFVTAHEKAIALYTDFHFKNIARNAKKIFTVSHFSASRIAKHYHVDPSRIAVVTNGFEHFSRITPDDGVFARFPKLKKGGFYFILGSLQKRKNLRYVLLSARKYTSAVYAIAGGKVTGYEAGELTALQNMPNVILTGRLTDGEVKAMMLACKAFLFPSLYEGFGIPPLEALSVGAKVIVSDIPVFHEIFGDAVRYIDPKSDGDDLDALLRQQHREQARGRLSVLKAHTYKEAARLVIDYIF